MKYLGIILLIWIVTLSCRPKEENTTLSKQNENSSSIKWNLLESEVDPKILNITYEFLDTLNRNRKIPLKACRLFVEQKDGDVKFKISPTVYLSTIKNDLPSGYIRYNGIIILVYTGFEKLYHEHQKIPGELAGILRNKLIDDLLPDHETIDPEFSHDLSSYATWECAVQGDSVVLTSRHAKPAWGVIRKVHKAPNSLRMKKN